MRPIPLIIALFVALALGGCGFSGRQEPPWETMHGNVDTTLRPNVPAEVLQKLRELNEWERKYGNRVAQRLNYDVPGEAQASMSMLKRELSEMGYVAQWNAQRAECVLVRKDADTKE
jgi:hypothetical protein